MLTFIGFLCLWSSPISLISQTDSISISQNLIDSLGFSKTDSLTNDSTPSRPRARKGLPIAPSSLDDKVDYGARDSMYFDAKNKQLHLWGDAFVKYTSIDLKAGYITVDYENNEVSAEPYPDSTGQMAGIPEFKEGEQAFEANKLRYNFKSKKGIIYEARTKQAEMYVLGTKAKFSSNEIERDTGFVTENVIYNQDALITSCDHDHPHFGIRTKKLKVISDKLVVAGLSNLEIEGIPTPLFLPFGFYPVTKNKKAGIILPRDFQFFSATQGLGIQGFGYYQPISEYMDLQMRFDYFVRGSYKVGGNLRYKKKYKYDGNFDLEYNDRKQENQFAERFSQKSFAIRWNHTQSPKAHPTRKIGGNINIQTNRNDNRVQNDFQSVYRNQLSSNMTYSKSFPGRPYSLNASFGHSQNNQTREMTVNFPNVRFQMQRIYPLKRKKRVGAEKWYEKVSLTYNSEARNQMRGIDSTFFTKQTLEDAQFGIQHKASSDIQLKLFKYINIAPNISYEENWYGRTREFEFDPTRKLKFDTILVDSVEVQVLDTDSTQWGKVDTITNWGFQTYRNYNAGISANTNLYFTKRFKKGWFRGVRHVLTPSASIGFGPDYSDDTHFFRSYQYTNEPGVTDSIRQYGIFDGAIFGRPSQSPRSTSINYSLRNVLEMKFRSKKDTTGSGLVKKTIFNNLTFSGSYSLTRDTLKWSTISTGGSFKLFKGVSNVNWRTTFDPYIVDPITGNRINKFAIKEEGKLLRLTTMSASFSSRMTMRKLRNMVFGGEDDEKTNPTPPGRSGGGTAPNTIEEITFASIFDDMTLNHYMQINRELQRDGSDTFLIRSHTLGVSGRIPLTSKWAMRVGNISYDFKSSKLVYPDIGLTRDLHCWTLDFSWQPVRGTFNFSIFVNNGTLNFLKVPYRRNNLDPPLGF